MVAQMVKSPPTVWETRVRSLEKGMATYSSVLTWKFHGQRSLAGYSSWSCKRIGHDLATKHGKGNGNLLQYSCLENPVDRGAWRAAVHGGAQSWTRLKRLSMHVCIGEGTGNPLRYSCLENLRDRGTWWTAVYGVSQSQTRLKWLSSSSD